MTRYKEELRKKGYKLEIDYPYLPISIGNAPALEGVRTFVKDNEILICQYYVVGTIIRHIERNLEENLNKQEFN